MRHFAKNRPALIYCMDHHAIDKVHKELSEETIRHITTAKVIYKPINADITNIRSTGCKPKSWELNYPALTF